MIARRSVLALPWVALFAPLAETQTSIGTSIVQKRVAETLGTDGTVAEWTLAKEPAGNVYVDIWRNGLHLTEGVDYSLSGQTVKWIPSDPPGASDLLTAKYWAEFIA